MGHHRPIGTVAPNTQPLHHSNTTTTVAGLAPRSLEPTDAGIIPPEYRTSFRGVHHNSTAASVAASGAAAAATASSSSQQHQAASDTSPSSKKTPASAAAPVSGGDSSRATGNNAGHQYSPNPVEEWAKEQVCQWLLALGMESYITLFMDKTITGAALLNLDSSGLKELGIKNKEDREKIKKKIKELKSLNERDKKEQATKNREPRTKSAAENFLIKQAEKVIKKK